MRCCDIEYVYRKTVMASLPRSWRRASNSSFLKPREFSRFPILYRADEEEGKTCEWLTGLRATLHDTRISLWHAPAELNYLPL
jgi:hypothetical protein